jgi:hypothetical protein
MVEAAEIEQSPAACRSASAVCCSSPRCSALELAGRLGPSSTDAPLGLSEVLKPPVAAPVTTASPGATGTAAAAPASLKAPPDR